MTRGWAFEMVVLGGLIGSLLLAMPSPAATAETAEPVTLTSGVVKAIDHASGVLMLDSGRKLRVRIVILNDEIADVARVRIDDQVFVSGIEVDPSTIVRTGQ